MVGDTPFFFGRPLSLPLSDRLLKMNKKSMWEGKKFPIFLCTRRQILAHRAAVRRVEMCPLNDKINSEEVF